MIFRLKSRRKRWEEDRERKTKWHMWFAWLPTRVDHDHVIWFRKIERRLNPDFGFNSWEYRDKTNNIHNVPSEDFL